MKTALLALCALCTLSGLAAGQNSDYKKGEFFAGASIVGLDEGNNADRPGLKGFETAGVYNVSRYFGIKGDFSAAFDKSRQSTVIPLSTNTVRFDLHRRLINVLGGVQIKDNANKGILKPFAHALIGVGNLHESLDNFQCSVSCASITPTSSSQTGFAGAFGGGLDLRINRRIQIRAFSIDYNPVRLNAATGHNIRLSAGIVF